MRAARASDDPSRNIEATLDRAEASVLKAFKDNELPEDWWQGREAILRIRMVIAAAAPIIEEGVLDWFEKEMLPLIIEKTTGGASSPSTTS